MGATIAGATEAARKRASGRPGSDRNGRWKSPAKRPETGHDDAGKRAANARPPVRQPAPAKPPTVQGNGPGTEAGRAPEVRGK